MTSAQAFERFAELESFIRLLDAKLANRFHLSVDEEAYFDAILDNYVDEQQGLLYNYPELLGNALKAMYASQIGAYNV